MPIDFSALKLKPFISPGFGLVFMAPENWVVAPGDRTDLFQINDPANGLSVTASAYSIPNIGIEQWGQIRLRIVAEKMPYFKPIKQPYTLLCSAGQAIVCEYAGNIPQDTGATQHYLVMCLQKNGVSVSLTLTCDDKDWAASEALYQHLLTKVDIYNIVKVPLGADGKPVLPPGVTPATQGAATVADVSASRAEPTPAADDRGPSSPVATTTPPTALRILKNILLWAIRNPILALFAMVAIGMVIEGIREQVFGYRPPGAP